MAKPKGKLTAAQLEIMREVWSAGSRGAKAVQVWRNLSASRKWARTTVQTMIERLYRRGWLLRDDVDGVYHYWGARSEAQATEMMTRSFVDVYFKGSASQLVMSLLGDRRIEADELEKLRRLLDNK